MKIGLEVHIQLPTASKLFCSCSTSGEDPNSSVCPVCLGYPGSRPSLNRKALEMGVLIAKFLDCQITEKVWFSRKTYFYPDLPKNFQITQYESPLGTNGHFPVGSRSIGIWRAHLEEDPGRIRRVGRAGEEQALVDYNRSGVPLVEIVTAPELTSPAEARDFLTDLLIELRHLTGVSGDEQSIRVDANISVGEVRVEIKNITGLKNVEKGLKFELTRQTKMLAAGKKIVRETRRFDEDRGTTLPAREKEFEEDYGYIEEPDLGTYTIGPLGRALVVPETPLTRAARLESQYGIPTAAARQIVLTSWSLTDMFERLCVASTKEGALTWTLGALSANWKALEPRLDEAMRSEIASTVAAVCRGEMTDAEGRMRISGLAGGEKESAEAPIVENVELDELVERLVEAHPEIVQDYQKNDRAANFLIGQVMKETKGRYSSKEVAEKMKKELEKRV
jgi:aspartyl-tRNA(Asn)/glutamyl-tRNA(Gln) amidotransferase subunit B